MAYIAPIHRATGVRHALKANLLDPEEECLIVAKANRVEIWTWSAGSLELQHTKRVYGTIAMLQKIRPANSTMDHILIGTERFMYFIAAWNSETEELDTIQNFVDVSEKHMRDSQSTNICMVDPTSRFVVMQLFEGVLNLTKVLKPRKNVTNYVDEPQQVKLAAEIFVVSSTFLYTESKQPKLALLFKDLSASRNKLRLVTYRIINERGEFSRFDPSKDRENDVSDVDPTSTLLIPVPKSQDEKRRYIYRNVATAKAQLGGVIVVGQTILTYLDDESKAVVRAAVENPTIFVAWERYDNARYLLGDEYGYLHLLTLEMRDDIIVDMVVKKLGRISTPVAMVYLGENLLYVGSHSGNSQVVHLNLIGKQPSSTPLPQQDALNNIGPILDFVVMDMGGHTEGGQYANPYSSGQARLVTGSGAYQDGSLRSVRSGVGLVHHGEVGLENSRALFSLKVNSQKDNIIVASFIGESRIFRFDANGEVEELPEFLGIILTESTLLAMNLPSGRVLQVTGSRVLILEGESGILLSSWHTNDADCMITSTSANESFVLISIGGDSLVVLDVNQDLAPIATTNFSSEQPQVSCVHIPAKGSIAVVGFWRSETLPGSVSIMKLPALEILYADQLSHEDSAAIPRSIVMTQILPEEKFGPSLLIAMSDGMMLTFTVDEDTYKLSGKKSIVLGIEQAYLQVLAKNDGLFNVFATSEHSSLIYGHEGRIVFSAIEADDAICLCPFDSEAFPGAILLATADVLRISVIDTQMRTHVKTLHAGDTIRRIAYSESEKVFGIGSIKRVLKGNIEETYSTFRVVDEVMLGDLSRPIELETRDSLGIEQVETVIRAKLPNERGDLEERFIVGTGILQTLATNTTTLGYIRVYGLREDRTLYEIMSHGLKGACRQLAVVDGKIFAALMKTVVVFDYSQSGEKKAKLIKLASYRTITVPVDISVYGNIVAIGDLMKALTLVEFLPGKNPGDAATLVEIARHPASFRTTAISHIEDHTYLEADDEGNLNVLRRNVEGVFENDRAKLLVTSEINIGEMVNKINKIEVEPLPNAVVEPKAFLATTEGSIFLFATITPNYQDLLMRLQARLAVKISSPGNLDFNSYRCFKNSMVVKEEPMRFVDGELMERFLDCPEDLQKEICQGLGPGVEDVRNMIEELKRLH